MQESHCRAKALSLMTRWAPLFLSAQDEEGRFRNGPEWGTAFQDCTVVLAYLYTLDDAANPYHSDPRLLQAVARAGDLHCHLWSEEGEIEFWSRGSNWGKSTDVWSFYAWLHTYEMVAPYLEPEREARWGERLEQIATRLYATWHEVRARVRRTGEEPFNLYQWHTFALYYAGRHYNRADWMEEARQEMHWLLDWQSPDGYWGEGLGPTTAYHRTAVAAMGVYQAISQDPEVLPALARALRFSREWTYPDGISVETIDGRVHHYHLAWRLCPVIYTRWPEGRAYYEAQLDCFLTHPVGFEPDGVWTFGFARFYPDMHRFAVDGLRPADWQVDGLCQLHDRRALRRWETPWFIALSGYPFFGKHANRFILQRHNLLSIWHQDTGLMVGGGPAREQPELATFAVTRNGETFYCPWDGTTWSDDQGDHLRARVGPATCLASVRREGTERVSISLSVGDLARDDQAEARLMLRLPLGGNLILPDESVVGLGTEPVVDVEIAPGAVVHVKPKTGAGWAFWCDRASRLRWPLDPFNPYVMSNRSPADEYLGTLTVPCSRRIDNVAFSLAVESPARNA